MDLHAVLEPVVSRLALEPAVQAVIVVGSHASGYATPSSDIDLFVFVDRPHEVLLDRRRAVIDELADPEQLSVLQQPGHPHTDVLMLRDTDVWLDVMFWTTAWADDELDWRLDRASRQMGGASTAFWRSIRDGIPLFDRSGWLDELQRRACLPYPEALRAEVIRHNRELLGARNPFSFRNQVVKAVAERDAVAAQHSTAAWLVCYFDLLFGANRVLHPGEKRLVAFAESECRRIPPDLRADVEWAVRASTELDPSIGTHLDWMLTKLDEVIAATD